MAEAPRFGPASHRQASSAWILGLLVPRRPKRRRTPSRVSSSFTVLLQRSFPGERDAGPTGRQRCVRWTRVENVVTAARASPSNHLLLSIAPSRLKNICAVSTGRRARPAFHHSTFPRHAIADLKAALGAAPDTYSSPYFWPSLVSLRTLGTQSTSVRLESA